MFCYTGLVEFIVNAMGDTPMPYLEEEYMEEEEVVTGTIPS